MRAAQGPCISFPLNTSLSAGFFVCKLKKLSNVKPESDDKEDSALNAEEQAAAATVDGGFEDDRQVQPHVYAAVVQCCRLAGMLRVSEHHRHSCCSAMPYSGGAACCKAAAENSVSDHRSSRLR
jgi:hypothetical protein